MDKATSLNEATGWLHLPLRERIADKLGDILFAGDEILDMIRQRAGEAPVDETISDIEQRVSALYEQINELMGTIAD